MQLWQAVREQLKTIERLRTSSSHNYDILNGIQAGLERVRKAGSGSGASAGTGTGAPSEKEGDAQEKERKLKTLYRELKVKTLEEHGCVFSLLFRDLTCAELT